MTQGRLQDYKAVRFEVSVTIGGGEQQDARSKAQLFGEFNLYGRDLSMRLVGVEPVAVEYVAAEGRIYVRFGDGPWQDAAQLGDWLPLGLEQTRQRLQGYARSDWDAVLSAFVGAGDTLERRQEEIEPAGTVEYRRLVLSDVDAANELFALAFPVADSELVEVVELEEGAPVVFELWIGADDGFPHRVTLVAGPQGDQYRMRLESSPLPYELPIVAPL